MTILVDHKVQPSIKSRNNNGISFQIFILMPAATTCLCIEHMMLCVNDDDGCSICIIFFPPASVLVVKVLMMMICAQAPFLISIFKGIFVQQTFVLSAQLRCEFSRRIASSFGHDEIEAQIQRIYISWNCDKVVLHYFSKAIFWSKIVTHHKT